ncbi:MAG: NAD(P)-dependent oxidoreductase [Clostridiales Family XIII bacterium]|jgi:3-hydroxyisobutyrate dehydrogenase/glyoxylate/succinic semialdehyde reductase|nr:NAD(P)-dependent oxidoreductase [Clostridiales Family XIII bacterium]
MKRVGWIGVGKMGSRMSRRLLEQGYTLNVYDVDPTNIAALKESGAGVAGSPAELAKMSDYVFSMIPNSAVLKTVLEQENGLLQVRGGYTLIDMSTLDPASSLLFAEKLSEAGIGYLRAPVTGSTEYAEKGTLGVMVSGDEALFNEILPLFKILGNRQTYLGDAEQARYMKISVNLMVGVTMQMLAEALVLGEKAGIKWDDLIDMISDSAAAAPIVKFKADALKNRDFSPMSTARVAEKDLQFALDIAKDEGISLPLTALTTQYYAAMRLHGLGDIDYSGILLLNEKFNKIE